MRFEQLKCLVTVADTASITAAAQKLFISQQAVSMNIKQLEDELAHTLLIRTKTGILLTPSGEKAVVFAKKILDEKDNFMQDMQQKRQVEAREIHICSTSAVTNIVLPNIIDDLDVRDKKLSLKITLENNLDCVLQSLQQGRYDIGLLTFNEKALAQKLQYYREDLQMEMLARDEMVAVMHKRFRSNSLSQISYEAFGSDYLLSLFNIIPIDTMMTNAREQTIVWSNDAEFHRRMMEKKGVLVLMPGLAYQYFFTTKRYMIVPIEDFEVPLIHAAVYRKGADRELLEFIDRIRLEMHMK